MCSGFFVEEEESYLRIFVVGKTNKHGVEVLASKFGV